MKAAEYFPKAEKLCAAGSVQMAGWGVNMNTESGEREQDPSDSKSNTLSAERVRQILSTRPDALQSYLVATGPSGWYRSSAFGVSTIFSAYLFVRLTMWAVQFARAEQPHYAVYCSLLALSFPMLPAIAYFDAKRTGKGLTTDYKYQEILRSVIWGKLNGYLGLCYILIFSALTLTGNLFPSHMFK